MLPLTRFTALRQSSNFPSILAGLLLLGMGATVLAALGLQHIGGYIPCKLCLEERLPYYGGLPLMVLVVLLGKKLPTLLVRLLFFIILALMLYNAGLSIYHAGAEWKFWAGPSDCTTAAAIVTENAASLLDNLNAARPASCDEASFILLGLSLAGWNALVSLLFALMAAIGVLERFPKSGNRFSD